MIDEPCLNVFQVRDILKVSLRTVYNMLSDGRLQRGKKNTSLITRASVEQLKALMTSHPCN